jgi:hypothetical protein
MFARSAKQSKNQNKGVKKTIICEFGIYDFCLLFVSLRAGQQSFCSFAPRRAVKESKANIAQVLNYLLFK